MQPSEYERMAAVEDRSWWFWGLHMNLLAAWRQAAAPGLAAPCVLDAGCGTGGFLARMRRAEPQARCFGIDIETHAAAMARAKSQAATAVGSIAALPVAPGTLDAVFSADVLCHRGVEPEAALAAIHACLKPGGVVIINLPAYSWLFSGHDRAVDNVRRFGRGEVGALLRRCGFTRIRLRHWNSVLFPAMVLKRLVRPSAASDVALLPAPFERRLRAIIGLELWLGRHGLRFPFGGSILATAVRP